jgi:hypothetical protein
MVTGAAWADISGNSIKELIIVGEWMSPRIFSFVKDHFVENKTNLADMLGWWQTVAVTDINGDGKNDLILGNIGENFYLRPGKGRPVKLWVNDFDQNNSRDRILTSTINGKDMPVFMKHEMEDQIPSLKKKNLKHRDYANKSMQELFSPELIRTCKIRQFNYGASVIAINTGDNRFTVQKLPTELQLSSVNAVYCTDLDEDGKQDIILGGNEYGFLPQFDRLDAGMGAVMLNKSGGRFKLLNRVESGMEVNGQVRDIQKLKGGNAGYILFLRNDMYPVLFKVNKTAGNNKP